MSATDRLQQLQFRSTGGAYSTTHCAYFPGDEEHAGFAPINHPSPDEPAELASLRVRDECRGRGIGGALLEHAGSEPPGTMTLHAKL